ncbi:CDP-diacylglycerol--serine O-phosphatidyltransferase [Candidatus Dependentiae bacterium]|nr:CDP-diacylglycerol--serine O-phosphatidyltransferase [Candidatus Dependentiae bacterium]
MALIDKIKQKKDVVLQSKNKINLKKGLTFIPNLFTLGNAFFGFCSIVFAATGKFFPAGYFILLGALMDALDGRLARLFKTQSSFGVQLDSLSDVISFCLAPAFLIYVWQLKYLGFLGIIFSSIFLLAGLLRLARFNVIHEQQTLFFLGVPTTIAGCFLATLMLNTIKIAKNDFFLIFIAFLQLLLAFLMISTIPFPTFKQKLPNLNKNLYLVFFIILFAIIAVLQFNRVLLLLFAFYFLNTIFIYFFRFEKK